MKDDFNTNSHYLTYAFSLQKVGRMYFLSSGVKGLTSCVFREAISSWNMLCIIIGGSMQAGPKWLFRSDFPSCSELAEIWHVYSLCVKKCPCGDQRAPGHQRITGLRHSPRQGAAIRHFFFKYQTICDLLPGLALTQIAVYVIHKSLAAHNIMEVMHRKIGLLSTNLKNIGQLLQKALEYCERKACIICEQHNISLVTNAVKWKEKWFPNEETKQCYAD